MDWFYTQTSFDWLYRADDDTYAIIENLRLMLLHYSTEDPLYFGFLANTDGGRNRFLRAITGYFNFVASGAGFVLSKQAFRQLVERGLNNSEYCEQGLSWWMPFQMSLRYSQFFLRGWQWRRSTHVSVLGSTRRSNCWHEGCLEEAPIYGRARRSCTCAGTNR